MNSIIKSLLALGLLVGPSTYLVAEVYKVKLARVQPYKNKVTIECYESHSSYYQATYNHTNSESLDVKKESSYRQDMDPGQAVMLGCQELDVDITRYALSVARNNNIVVNITDMVELASDTYEKSRWSKKITKAIVAIPSFFGLALTTSRETRKIGIITSVTCGVVYGIMAIEDFFFQKNYRRLIQLLQSHARAL